ncbi:MAG TPA: hypothetical protein VGH27_09185 [Streptosporangiaceae bacterium]|jgi:hypothetical protein
MNTKKGVQVVVMGAQRRNIDITTMAQLVIALGRELAGRRETKKHDAQSMPVEAAP